MELKVIREKRGMTQQQLADAIGVVRSAVANWESGLSTPKVQQLPALSDVLGCSIDQLFGRETTERR